jgi:hypothetical protein
MSAQVPVSARNQLTHKLRELLSGDIVVTNKQLDTMLPSMCDIHFNMVMHADAGNVPEHMVRYMLDNGLTAYLTESLLKQIKPTLKDVYDHQELAEVLVPLMDKIPLTATSIGEYQLDDINNIMFIVKVHTLIEFNSYSAKVVGTHLTNWTAVLEKEGVKDDVMKGLSSRQRLDYTIAFMEHTTMNIRIQRGDRNRITFNMLVKNPYLMTGVADISKLLNGDEIASLLVTHKSTAVGQGFYYMAISKLHCGSNFTQVVKELLDYLTDNHLDMVGEIAKDIICYCPRAKLVERHKMLNKCADM